MEKSITGKKTIGNEIHELTLNDMGEACGENRWFDRRPRRFELVYTWFSAATGGCKGQVCHAATWKDYRLAKKVGILNAFDLF